MKITINGQEKKFKAPFSIHDCLAQGGYGGMTIAVARNRAFVPRGDYAQIFLEDGDEIEIVAPMQGG